MSIRFVCVGVLVLAAGGADLTGQQYSGDGERKVPYYETKQWKEGQAKLANEWNAAMDMQLPFASDLGLFNRFNCIQVASPKEMVPFEGKRRTPWLIKSSQNWMDRILRGDFSPKLAELRPLRMLERSRGRPCLLYYEWQRDGLDLAMWESQSGILVEIRRKSGLGFFPTDKGKVMALLERVFQVDASGHKRPPLPPGDPIKVAQKNKEWVMYVPGGELAAGDTLSGYWQDTLIGIATEGRVLLLGLKVNSVQIMVEGKVVLTGSPNEPVHMYDQWFEKGLEDVQD